MSRGEIEEKALPEGWREVRLGEIAKIYSGGTPLRANAEYWGDEIPWIKTNQIRNKVIDLASIDEYISEKGLKNSAAKIVPKGAILMAMYGQGKTRGRVSVLGTDAAINQACAAIEVHESECRNFIFQQLRFRYKSIRNISNHGSQKNLSIGLISQLAVVMAPLPEQKAIASLLETWDTAIEKTEVLIAAKEKRFKWLLKTLISDQWDNPKWRKVKLGEISHFCNGYPFKSSSYTEQGTYFIITIGSVQNGFMTIHQAKTITELPADIQQHQILKKKDILVSMTGNVGRVCLVNKQNCLLNQRVGKIIPTDNCSKKFLFYTLHRKHFLYEMVSFAKGGAQGNLAKGDIMSYQIFLPSTSKQESIVNLLDCAKKETDVLKQFAEQYRTQKRGLMQKLLTGKWRN